MPDIAVMIPCLNEAATIGKVINDIRLVLPESFIVVYDNGSTDQSVSEAVKSGATVRRVDKKGKGNVIQAIFSESQARCTIIIDADDTYDVSCLPALARAILVEKQAMAVADRLSTTYLPLTHNLWHKQGNLLVNNLISHLYHIEVRDTLSGCRAFSHTFLHYPLHSCGFTIETELTLLAISHQEKVSYHPCLYRKRQHGHSKIHTFKDGSAILLLIIYEYLKNHYERRQLFAKI